MNFNKDTTKRFAEPFASRACRWCKPSITLNLTRPGRAKAQDPIIISCPRTSVVVIRSGTGVFSAIVLIGEKERLVLQLLTRLRVTIFWVRLSTAAS